MKTVTEQDRALFESLDVRLFWDSRTNTEVDSAALKGHEATQQNLC